MGNAVLLPAPLPTGSNASSALCCAMDVLIIESGKGFVAGGNLTHRDTKPVLRWSAARYIYSLLYARRVPDSVDVYISEL